MINNKTGRFKRIISLILAVLMVVTMFTLITSVIGANAAGTGLNGVTLSSTDKYIIRNAGTNDVIYSTGGTWTSNEDDNAVYEELSAGTLQNNDLYYWYIYNVSDNQYVFENASTGMVICFRQLRGIAKGTAGYRRFDAQTWAYNGWGVKYYSAALSNVDFDADSFTTTIVPNRAEQANSRAYIDTTNGLGWSDDASVENQNWVFEKVDVATPTTPSLNISTTTDDLTVTVSWNIVEGATNYQVSRDSQVIATVNGNSYEDTVDSYASYTYTVKALDANNDEIEVLANSATVVLSDPLNTPEIDGLTYLAGPFFIKGYDINSYAYADGSEISVVSADSTDDFSAEYMWNIYTVNGTGTGAGHFTLVNVSTQQFMDIPETKDAPFTLVDSRTTTTDISLYDYVNGAQAGDANAAAGLANVSLQGKDCNNYKGIIKNNKLYVKNTESTGHFTFVATEYPQRVPVDNTDFSLKATASDKDKTVTVSWKKITGAASYKLNGQPVTGTKYTFTNVANGTYNYEIAAYDEGGNVIATTNNTASATVAEYVEPVPGTLIGTYYIQNSFRNYPHWVVTNEYNEYLYGTGTYMYGDTQTTFAGATKSGEAVNVADLNNDATLSTDAYQWNVYKDANDKYYIRNVATGLYILNTAPTNAVAYDETNASSIAFYFVARTIGYQDENSNAPIKNVYDGDHLFNLIDGTQVDLNQSSDLGNDVFCASVSRDTDSNFLSSGFDTSNGATPTANSKTADISIRDNPCNGGERWTFIKVVEESSSDYFRVSIQGGGEVRATVITDGTSSEWTGGEDGDNNDWAVRPETRLILNATPNDDYAFVGWQDVRNKDMISTDTMLNTFVGTKTHIRAIFIKKQEAAAGDKVRISVKNSTTGYLQQFVDEDGVSRNYLAVDKGTAFAGSAVETVISDMTNELFGYEIVGYEVLNGDNSKTTYSSFDELKAGLSQFDRDVVITVVYQATEGSVVLTFIGDFGTVKGDIVEVTDDGFKATLKFNQTVTVTAMSDNFSYWTYNGQVVSNKKTATFAATDKDVTIVAVENDEANKLSKPTNTLTGYAFDPNSDYLFLYEHFNSMEDQGFTIIEKGALLIEDKGQVQTELTLSTEGVLKARSASTSDSFYARKSDAKGRNWYAQAYVIYLDSEGTVHQDYAGSVLHIVEEWIFTPAKVGTSVVDFSAMNDAGSAQGNVYIACRNGVVTDNVLTINATDTAASGKESVISLGIEVPNNEKYIVLKVKGDIELSNIMVANKPYSGANAAVEADYSAITTLKAYNGNSLPALTSEYQYWIIDREASGLTYATDVIDNENIIDLTLAFAGTGSVSIEDIFLSNYVVVEY